MMRGRLRADSHGCYLHREVTRPFASIRHHRRCPQCGSHLERDDHIGTIGFLATLLFLHGFRCTAECGWSGFRFSRSQFLRRKRKVRAALVVLLFLVIAAVTVRFVLSRVGLGSGPLHDEGIQEVE
jgi:hypothetical protein